MVSTPACPSGKPVVWHIAGRGWVVSSLHIGPKNGVHGPNQKIVKALTGFAHSLSDPWIILGDWNHSPEHFKNIRYYRP